MSDQPTRNRWIDLLRGFSAVAVALFHFNVIADPPTESLSRAWYRFWILGYLGVPIFFTLSGYSLVSGWLKATSVRAFLHHRLTRLLPPYWFSLGLVLSLAVAVKLATGVNDIATLPRHPWPIVATIFILNEPYTPVARVGWIYWTLTPLLCYALMLGALLRAPGNFRPLLLAGLHAALCAADLVIRPTGADWHLLLACWPLFGAGIALSLRSARRPFGNLMLGVTLAHAILSLLLGRDMLVILSSLLTVVFLAVQPRNPTSPRWTAPFGFVGRISYSLYLIHIPLGTLLLDRLLPALGPPGSVLIGRQLLLLLLCLGGAAIFHRFCEQPFQSTRPTA